MPCGPVTDEDRQQPDLSVEPYKCDDRTSLTKSILFFEDNRKRCAAAFREFHADNTHLTYQPHVRNSRLVQKRATRALTMGTDFDEQLSRAISRLLRPRL